MQQYQRLAATTAADLDRGETGWPQRRLSVSALGLVGEAGEVAELVKKHVGHGHPLDLQKLAKELGDVFWYLADICTICGLDLGDVAV